MFVASFQFCTDTAQTLSYCGGAVGVSERVVLKVANITRRCVKRHNPQSMFFPRCEGRSYTPVQNNSLYHLTNFISNLTIRTTVDAVTVLLCPSVVRSLCIAFNARLAVTL